MNAVTIARRITDNVLILNEMKATHGVYQDDHNNGTSLRTTPCVGRYVVGEKEYIVMLFETVSFCLNPMYRDGEGAVHLDTCSIGGVVNVRGCTLDVAVERFNEEEKSNPWCKGGQITEIIRFA